MPAARRPKTFPPGRIRSFHSLTPPGFASRSVRIYVPSTYHRDEPRPALFLFDGQNVFDDKGSFAGGWRVHEAVDGLTASTVIAPLVVAIDHGNERRIEELSPFDTGRTKGRADAFLDWVARSVVPMVRGEYNLPGGSLGACVGGSSLGGLAAMYAHFRNPETFGGAMCLSPSFWVGREAIHAYVGHHPTPQFSRIYLDCGAKEGGMRLTHSVQRMQQLFLARGYTPKQLMWRPDSKGTHSERHWRRRIPKALRFMFRRA